MSILLPLYMYPWSGVWDPLYTAAWDYPKMNFTVILNPCSGPCVNSTPQTEYLVEMPKLKDHANIRSLGYVATNYTNKPIDVVLQEIHTYANWSKILNDTRISVDGIFFDETPGTYDWRAHDYLARAKQEVKSLRGLGQQIIVHNPGTIPYPTWNYIDVADITVVWENTWTKWIDASNFNQLKNLTNTLNSTKSTFALMIHSVPNIPDELVDWTVAQMKNLAGWNFLSSVSYAGEYWHSFSTIYRPFVDRYAKG